MSAYNSTAFIVDDQNQNIHYSSGWEPVASTSAEYGSTKTGAASAGLTASFTFTGTGVEVYGSLGSIDVYGQPVTTYSIDGQSPSTYVAPIIQPGLAYTHIMFYRSPILSAAQHTLVITNTNGTKPSVYWLDYIVYTPSTNSNPPPPPVTSPSSEPPKGPTSQPSEPSSSPSQDSQDSPTHAASSTPSVNESSAQSQASTKSFTGSISGTSSSVINPASPMSPAGNQATQTGNSVTSSSSSTGTTLPVVAASHSKHSAGAIAGGVIGAIVILAAAVLVALFYYRRRRPEEITLEEDRPAPDNIVPFGSWSSPQHAYGNEKGARDESVVSFYPAETSGAGPSTLSPGMGQTENFASASFSPGVTGSSGLERNVSTGGDVVSPRPVPNTSGSDYSSAASDTPLLPPPRAGGQGVSQSQLRLHQDSGLRLPPPPSLIDVPPVYSRE